MDLRIAKSPEETAKEFAEYLIQQHEKTDVLHVALSGGSTPKILFDLLATEFKMAIDWNRIHLYWGDERCVQPTDDESNFKMTQDRLISKVAIPEENIHRVKGETNPDEEAARYSSEIEKHLEKKNGLPVFDIIILGMGSDGHTASIFPHEIELLESDAICAVANHPESGQKRVTLTGQVINAAKSVCFLVTGEGKKEKVREIIKKEDSASDYPAAHIKVNDGELIWFLDDSAAAELN